MVKHIGKGHYLDKVCHWMVHFPYKDTEYFILIRPWKFSGSYNSRSKS